jgi:hypothetical protein
MTMLSATQVEHVHRTARTAGVAGFLLLLVNVYVDPASAFHSYLFVWWFVLGIPLGSMALLMVHNLTGGGWGELLRPALEAATRTLPAVLLLSVPLWFGLGDLYAWARPAAVSASALLRAKAWYLAPTWFFLRMAIYFAVWLTLARLLGNWSAVRLNATAGEESARLRAVSAIGLLAYALSITIAAVDWVMSLSPEWYSTNFGLLAGIGQALCAFSFAVVCAAWYRRGPASDLPALFNDLGNLLLMFVMVWAYLAFTQYLIIWSEDLPNEIVWYLPRVQTSWRLVAIFLVVFHFALPFLVLLSRRAKRAPQALGALAAALLFAHLVDAFWLVMPAHRPDSFGLGWSDLFAMACVIGLWLSAFLRVAQGRKAQRSTAKFSGAASNA